MLVALFVLVVGILWLRREPGPSVPSSSKPAADPMAGRRQKSPPAVAASPAAPTERQFLDPADAGAIAYGSGDYESALARYQAAVEKNPKDAESWSNLGQVLVRLNRAPEAIPAFQRAIENMPDRWAYEFNLARALGVAGRWDEAIATYRRAQALFPDDDVTAFNLAMALHKKGDEAAAVTAYQKAITLAPEDPSFRMALGISLEKLGRASDAAAAYKEYLRLAPGAPDAEKVAARIGQLSAPGSTPAPPPAPPTSGTDPARSIR